MIRTARLWLLRFGGGRYLKFMLVGVINAVVDLLVLNLCLLINPTKSPGLLVLYNTIAVISAIATSYELNRRWTFSDRSKNPRKEQHLFFAQGILNVLLNNSAMVFISRILYSIDMPFIISSNLSKVIAMAISSGVSYVILRNFVYHA